MISLEKSFSGLNSSASESLYMAFTTRLFFGNPPQPFDILYVYSIILHNIVVRISDEKQSWMFFLASRTLSPIRLRIPLVFDHFDEVPSQLEFNLTVIRHVKNRIADKYISRFTERVDRIHTLAFCHRGRGAT